MQNCRKNMNMISFILQNYISTYILRKSFKITKQYSLIFRFLIGHIHQKYKLFCMNSNITYGKEYTVSMLPKKKKITSSFLIIDSALGLGEAGSLKCQSSILKVTIF